MDGEATGGRANTTSLPTTSTDGSVPQDSAALAIGSALLLLGTRRGSLIGTASAIGGAALVYRGLRGPGALSQLVGWMSPGGGGTTTSGASNGAPEVERWITIGKPADEIYRFWRSPGNLSQIMADLGDVTELDGERSHWEARLPGGKTVAWDSRIVEDRPGELIRWESLPGTDIPNEGAIRFRSAPGDRGTEAGLSMWFEPPGGAVGEAAVNFLGFAPRAATTKALHRLRSLVETGEVPTLAHNPSARGMGDRI